MVRTTRWYGRFERLAVLLMLVIRIAKWQNMVCGAIDDLLALTLLIRRL
jgi:hypothetical protein